DATGGRVEQDGLPALQPVGAAEQVLDREALEHHRGGDLEADTPGKLHQRLRRHVAQFRVRTGRAIAVGDAVADLHVRDAVADGRHDAGALEPDLAGHRLRVQAVAEIDVDVVQPDRMVAHLRLAGTGRTDVDVDVLHDLGTAGLRDADGLGHGRLLRTFRDRRRRRPAGSGR